MATRVIVFCTCNCHSEWLFILQVVISNSCDSRSFQFLCKYE